jgi:hypothetical protein
VTCPACAGPPGQKDKNGCQICGPGVACPSPVCKENEKLYFTEEYDANQCKIYKCYSTDCPEGCVCHDNGISCPTTPPVACPAPVCKENDKTYFTGEYDENKWEIYKWYTGDCPKGCICDANTVTCPTSPPVGCAKPFCGDNRKAYFTGKYDKNNCAIYECDSHDCPEGCKCDANTVTCPTGPPIACSAPVCKDNKKPYFTGQYDNNKCMIYKCYETDCPKDCICEANTVSCKTSIPINAEITTAKGDISISFEKVSAEKISVKEGLATIQTAKKLIIEEKKLMMETSKGNKEVKVMPSTASETALNQLRLKGYTIELKDTGKPVYEVTGKKDVKVLGLFKSEMTITSTIDAQTGAVEKTTKPWWGFMASG